MPRAKKENPSAKSVVMAKKYKNTALENGLDALSGAFFDLKLQRKVAKITMATSLSVLTLSAFNMQSKTARKRHTRAGAVMVASSIWHASLYGSRFAKFLNEQKRKRNSK